MQAEGRTTTTKVKIHFDRWWYLLLCVVIAFLDQFTKSLIKKSLPIGGEIRLFDGEIIWIQHVLNPGMAFGVDLFSPAFLGAIAFFSILVLTLYTFMIPHLTVGLGITLAMISGGAAGNLIDRVLYGEVTDFLSLDFPDVIMERWPTFNLADSSVLIGVLVLILFYHKSPSSLSNETESSQPPQ